MTNPILINELLADPSVSYWMKSSLQSALQRDPVDALRDAETLCEVLRQQLEFIGTN